MHFFWFGFFDGESLMFSLITHLFWLFGFRKPFRVVAYPRGKNEVRFPSTGISTQFENGSSVLPAGKLCIFPLEKQCTNDRWTDNSEHTDLAVEVSEGGIQGEDADQE